MSGTLIRATPYDKEVLGCKVGRVWVLTDKYKLRTAKNSVNILEVAGVKPQLIKKIRPSNKLFREELSGDYKRAMMISGV